MVVLLLLLIAVGAYVGYRYYRAHPDKQSDIVIMDDGADESPSKRKVSNFIYNAEYNSAFNTSPRAGTNTLTVCPLMACGCLSWFSLMHTRFSWLVFDNAVYWTNKHVAVQAHTSHRSRPLQARCQSVIDHGLSMIR